MEIIKVIDISVLSANSLLKRRTFWDIPRADVSDTVEARDPGRRLLGGGVGARSCPPSTIPRRYKGSSIPSGGEGQGHTRGKNAGGSSHGQNGGIYEFKVYIY